MSDLTKKFDIKEKSLKNKRLDKNMLIEKIQDNNLENDNENKNLKKKISCYKKISIKPLTARKKMCLTKRNIQKNIEEVKFNKNTKTNYFNYNNNSTSLNKNILMTYGNKEIFNYNDFNMNFTNLELVNAKILANTNPNILIYNDSNINIENNGKQFNNGFIGNNFESKQDNKDKIDSQNKNKIKEIIIKKNNIDITNDLNLSFHKAKKENVNINYINSISNNVYGKINSPIFLNRIYSLYNNINDDYDLLNTMTEPSRNNKLEINKNLKKKILLNENDLTLGINLKKNKTNSHLNYFNNLTEKNNSNNEEIEMNLQRNSQNRNKSEKLNFIENTKKIMSSIEKEKKKLIEDNHKNYIKYIKLIQKQRKQYKEYDQYLKKELQKNRNSQIKLELFQKNYFKNLKNKFKIQSIGIIPEFKTLSTKNLAFQKNRNRSGKNKMFSFNNLKNIIKSNKKNIKIEKYKPLMKKENSINLIETTKNRNTAKPFKRNVIQINEDELKMRNTTNLTKKSNKILNLMNNTNPHNFDKNLSKVSHLYINSNSIITPERSYNFQNQNCSSSDNRLITNSKKIKLHILTENKNIKTEKREFGKNKNILFLNKTKKSLILKKLFKNNKNQIENKCEYNRNKIINNNNKNYKRHVKLNSLKKIEDIGEFYNEFNISNNTVKNNNLKEKEIHKVILEEKKKIIHNSNEKKQNFKKLKKIIFFSGLKSKE